MSDRIRRCLECPQCHTRYLIGFSPFANGAYLIPTIAGSCDEYALYCSCGRSRSPSLWKSVEVKPYIVSKVANDRGYGTPQEILPISDQAHGAWPFGASRYLNQRSMEKGRNSR